MLSQGYRSTGVDVWPLTAPPAAISTPASSAAAASMSAGDPAPVVPASPAVAAAKRRRTGPLCSSAPRAGARAGLASAACNWATNRRCWSDVSWARVAAAAVAASDFIGCAGGETGSCCGCCCRLVSVNASGNSGSPLGLRVATVRPSRTPTPLPPPPSSLPSASSPAPRKSGGKAPSRPPAPSLSAGALPSPLAPLCASS